VLDIIIGIWLIWVGIIATIIISCMAWVMLKDVLNDLKKQDEENTKK